MEKSTRDFLLQFWKNNEQLIQQAYEAYTEEMAKSNSSEEIQSLKSPKDYTRFSINGEGNTPKSRIPIEVIELACSKGATAEDLIKIGHACSEQNFRLLVNYEFTYPEEQKGRRSFPVQTADGEKFFITNQISANGFYNCIYDFIAVIHNIKEGPFSKIIIAEVP